MPCFAETLDLGLGNLLNCDELVCVFIATEHYFAKGALSHNFALFEVVDVKFDRSLFYHIIDSFQIL